MTIPSIDFPMVSENAGPRAAVEKPFLLSDGRVGLEARLDRAIYAHGDPIAVHVNVNNNSSKTVRRIKVSSVLCVAIIGTMHRYLAGLETLRGWSSLEKQFARGFLDLALLDFDNNNKRGGGRMICIRDTNNCLIKRTRLSRWYRDLNMRSG